jgi:hypothetical protein
MFWAVGQVIETAGGVAFAAGFDLFPDEVAG